MKNKKLKLNIIESQKPTSQKEADKKLVAFFELLYSWHVEEQKKSNEEKV